MSDRQMQALRAHRDRLLEAGVPFTKVRRHLRELRDHLDELTFEAIEHGMRPDDARAWAQLQLGNLERIGDEMLANATERSLWYRYPRFMSVAAAPLIFVSSFIAVILILVAIVLGIEEQFGREQLLMVQPWLEPLCRALIAFLLYVLPLLLGLHLVRQQVWQRLPLSYLIFGLLFLAGFAASTEILLEWPASAIDEDGVIGANMLGDWSPLNILRLALILAICTAGWFRWRRQYDNEILG